MCPTRPASADDLAPVLSSYLDALRPPAVPAIDEYSVPWTFVSYDRRRGGIYVRESLQRAQWLAEDDFGSIDDEPQDDGSWFVRNNCGDVIGCLRIATAEEVESWRADEGSSR
jgi:hypothetical protein